MNDDDATGRDAAEHTTAGQIEAEQPVPEVSTSTGRGPTARASARPDSAAKWSADSADRADPADRAATARDSADRDPADPASAERTTAGQADDAYARRLEAVVAGHRGDAVLAAQFLTDQDATVRAAALGALARCGELGDGHIRSALSDRAVQVRRRAVELAPAGIDLTPMLDDSDASVVEAAAAALGERDWDPAPVPELCRVARSHDDPLCRESAVAALGAIAAGTEAAEVGAGSAPVGAGPTTVNTGAATMNAGPATMNAEAAPDVGTPAADVPVFQAGHKEARAAALDTLLAALEDRPQIRRRALLGLHQFDDERAVDAVRGSLEDRDRQVRAVAGELLGVPVR